MDLRAKSDRRGCGKIAENSDSRFPVSCGFARLSRAELSVAAGQLRRKVSMKSGHKAHKFSVRNHNSRACAASDGCSLSMSCR